MSSGFAAFLPAMTFFTASIFFICVSQSLGEFHFNRCTKAVHRERRVMGTTEHDYIGVGAGAGTSPRSQQHLSRVSISFEVVALMLKSQHHYFKLIKQISESQTE